MRILRYNIVIEMSRLPGSTMALFEERELMEDHPAFKDVLEFVRSHFEFSYVLGERTETPVEERQP